MLPSRQVYRLLLLVLAAGVLATSAAEGAPISPRFAFRNPLRDVKTGQPVSCPDPSVIQAERGPWRYFLVCTSDNAPDAFPIWMSKDLVHWARDGFVFPRGRQPWWAVHSTGGGRLGIYWAPEIYRFEGRWVLYFAAQYNPSSQAIAADQTPAPGTMVVGVAVSNNLAGPWQTRIVHYRGQFNATNGEQETHGGVIDPSVVQDPRTGQLYLFWAAQQDEIWAGQLSPGGVALTGPIRRVLDVSEPWECDSADQHCTVEGPEPYYANGTFYIFYSAANTWDSTYAIGVASSSTVLDPTLPFGKLATPILAAGHGFLGPGGISHPVVGPDGIPYVLYHALTHPLRAHDSSARLLMLGRLKWINSWPLVNNGVARSQDQAGGGPLAPRLDQARSGPLVSAAPSSNRQPLK